MFKRLEGQEERFEKDTEELVTIPTKFYKVTFKMPELDFVRDHTDTFTDNEHAVQCAKEEILTAQKHLKKEGKEIPVMTYEVSEYHP